MSTRADWLSSVLSIAPADRPRAESFLRDLYAAAGLMHPSQFFWFESPFKAAWAVALLTAPHDFFWQRILDAVTRNRRDREFLEHLRAEICETSCQRDWQSLVAEAGEPLDPPVRGFNRLPSPAKGLQAPLMIARMERHENVQEATRVYDDTDDLYRAEYHFRGVLSGQDGYSTINPLLLGHFTCEYPFSRMAMDEAAAEERTPPPILVAAWNVARSAGPLWPFSKSVVLSDRPAEIHVNGKWLLHRGDGPAAAYRDGSRLWAWNGHPMREGWITHPEDIPARDLKLFDPSFREYVAAVAGTKQVKVKVKPKYSSILKKDLSPVAEQCVAALRHFNNGRLPLFDRYLSGEHEKVWQELIALGALVREDPHAADALAVAYETMRRVEQNVRTISGRLESMGFKGTSERLHQAPGIKTHKLIDRLEKKAGTLPLSLRAFWEVVGAVDWIGEHPSLAPPNDSIAPDPLVVFSIEHALQIFEAGFADDQGAIVIGPDDLHKANTSGGEPYEIALPELGADAKVLNERHDLHFVDYLRLVFRFGGFAGYEGIDPVPAELAQLRAGLIAF